MKLLTILLLSVFLVFSSTSSNANSNRDAAIAIGILSGIIDGGIIANEVRNKNRRKWKRRNCERRFVGWRYDYDGYRYPKYRTICGNYYD